MCQNIKREGPTFQYLMKYHFILLAIIDQLCNIITIIMH